MTHEVQGRMLLREWFAWWEAIARLAAERSIAEYQTLLLGTSGWDVPDRADRLRGLYSVAYGVDVPAAQSAASATDEQGNGHAGGDNVHQQMRKAYEMLTRAYGPAIIRAGDLN
jgi:hypothetical protein